MTSSLHCQAGTLTLLFAAHSPAELHSGQVREPAAGDGRRGGGHQEGNGRRRAPVPVGSETSQTRLQQGGGYVPQHIRAK